MQATNFSNKVIPFDTFGVERLAVLGLCESFPTERSMMIHDIFDSENYHALVDLPEIDPKTYSSVDAFRHDRLVDRCWRKSNVLPVSIQKRDVAIEGFLRSEDHCRLMNIERPWVRSEIFPVIKRHIRRILGPLHGQQFEQILAKCNHGPGTTYDIGSRGAHSIRKYSSTLTLTKSLLSFRKHIMGENWFKYSGSGDVVWGSRFTTVPKNFKTDRGICIEPTLNMFFQKGIGGFIRSRLRRFGVDLNDQSINGRRALMAHSLGLATIDLSAASDSVSLELVRDLLPPRWFHLLELARSPSVLIQDKWVKLEKISSMGNGYTFELESLIFFAISSAFTKDVTVYGDDIIVPQMVAPDLVAALKEYGFTTNVEKSYLAGNFFESCGVDAFLGVNVTPFYLRRTIDANCTVDYPGFIANSLRCWAKDDPRYRPLLLLLEHISTSPSVPQYMGNVGVHRECCWKVGDRFKILTIVPRMRQYNSVALLLYRLRNRSVDRAYNNDVPLGKSLKYVTRSRRVSAEGLIQPAIWQVLTVKGRW